MLIFVTFIFFQVPDHLYVRFVERDSVKQAPCVVTRSYIRQRNRISVPRAAKRSIVAPP